MPQLPSIDASPDFSYTFSGHQSFAFRYPWLPKALQQLQQHPDLFRSDEAMARLGVGKNMVQSIRHWCRVLELIDSYDHITALGATLLLEEGWDPYLEDSATLWLLHWQLTRPHSAAITWQLSFSQWGQERFSRAALADWLLAFSERQGKRISPNSIKRDVDVFLRCYLPSQASASRPVEETFDSPLVELGLLTLDPEDSHSVRIPRGRQPSLPEAIFVYALHDYWQQVAPEQQSLSFAQLQYARGCPGAAFRLSDNALAARLETLPTASGLRFDETAGMRQLFRSGTQELLPLLETYYRR